MLKAARLCAYMKPQLLWVVRILRSSAQQRMLVYIAHTSVNEAPLAAGGVAAVCERADGEDGRSCPDRVAHRLVQDLPGQELCILGVPVRGGGHELHGV